MERQVDVVAVARFSFVSVGRRQSVVLLIKEQPSQQAGFLGRSVPVVLRAYGPANQGVPRTVWLSTGIIGAKWIVLALCAIGVLPVSTYLAALFATLYLAGVTFVWRE